MITVYVHQVPYKVAPPEPCWNFATSGYPREEMERFEYLLKATEGEISLVTCLESVVLRLSNLVRKGQVSHKNVKMFFYRDGIEGFEPTWVEIPMDEEGDFDQPIPDGLFEWRIPELF